MDSKPLEALGEWIAQSESSAWLRANPGQAETLAPYQVLDGAMRVTASTQCAAAEPSASALAAGRARVLAAVSARANPAGFRSWSQPVRAGAMVAMAVAAFGIAGGASAAFGGGGLGQAVLDAISGPTENQEGINNAADQADNGREHANENAFEGSGNSDDHAANGNGCQPTGTLPSDNANPNSAERCENAPDGIGNAGNHPNGGAGNANDAASEGSGNADADHGPSETPAGPPADP